MRMKFVVGLIPLLLSILILQGSLSFASQQTPSGLNYTPINLPGVTPLPVRVELPAPPGRPRNLIATLPQLVEDEEDKVIGPDDLGSEDDLDVTESGTVCTSPECLGDIDFAPMTESQTGTINQTSAALLQHAFNSYSNSTIVTEMIAQARQHIADDPRRYIRRVRGRSRPVTFCYRAVKDAMRDSGMVAPIFQGGGIAADAVRDLSRGLGFVNLLENPEVRHLLESNPAMAPKGTILIYDTAPSAPRAISRAGHIEIKTTDSGQHGYISISETTRPTYGYRIPQYRRLIGVMYKPALAVSPQSSTAPQPSPPTSPTPRQ